MNTPISWIKAYVPDLDADVIEIVDKMTLSGSNVECYEKKDKNLSRIIVARIEELEKHPGSSIFIIGYNTPLCVLSTIIEGYHRDYEMTLLKDASSAKSDGITPAKERHDMLTSVLSSFGEVETVDEVLVKYSY